MTSGELKILMALDKLAGGLKSYDVISGFFTPQFDSVTWSLSIEIITNETGLTVTGGSSGEGYVDLAVINAFAEGSPYDYKAFQVINGISMHQSCMIACNPDASTPDLILNYFSANAPNTFNPDSRGLGYEQQIGFPFEIRLYKVA